MADETAGRLCTVLVNGVQIAARTKTLNINNEPIDISDDEAQGFRVLLLEHAATRFIDMSIDGLVKTANRDLIDAAIGGGTTFTDVVINIDKWGRVTGDFWFGTAEIGMPYNDAVTFSGTFQSSGPFEYIPEST